MTYNMQPLHYCAKYHWNGQFGSPRTQKLCTILVEEWLNLSWIWRIYLAKTAYVWNSEIDLADVCIQWAYLFDKNCNWNKSFDITQEKSMKIQKSILDMGKFYCVHASSMNHMLGVVLRNRQCKHGLCYGGSSCDIRAVYSKLAQLSVLIC